MRWGEIIFSSPTTGKFCHTCCWSTFKRGHLVSQLLELEQDYFALLVLFFFFPANKISIVKLKLFNCNFACSQFRLFPAASNTLPNNARTRAHTGTHTPCTDSPACKIQLRDTDFAFWTQQTCLQASAMSMNSSAALLTWQIHTR